MKQTYNCIFLFPNKGHILGKANLKLHRNRTNYLLQISKLWYRMSSFFIGIFRSMILFPLFFCVLLYLLFTLQYIKLNILYWAEVQINIKERWPTDQSKTGVETTLEIATVKDRRVGNSDSEDLNITQIGSNGSSAKVR